MRKDARLLLGSLGLAGWREVGLEVVEAGYFLGGQGEAEQVEVLLDALGAGGSGDDDDADVDVPAQDDLGRGDAVLVGDLGYRAVAQPGALERAVALERDAALGVRGQQAGVVPGGAPWDLVDGRPLPRRLDQVVDLADAVVAHPYGPGQALVPGREEIAPQRHQVPAARRPVHQPQVNVVRAQRLQALRDGGPRAARVSGWQLGGDEQLGPADTAVGDGAADLLFVPVHGGGVDVPVADQEGVPGCLVGELALQLPGTKAEHRHGDAVTQVHGRNLGHASIVATAPERRERGLTPGSGTCALTQRGMDGTEQLAGRDGGPDQGSVSLRV